MIFVLHITTKKKKIRGQLPPLRFFHGGQKHTISKLQWDSFLGGGGGSYPTTFKASRATAPAAPLLVTPLIGLIMFHIKLKNIKIISY